MRCDIQTTFVYKLFMQKHGIFIPNLTQIQERILKIFDGKESMKLQQWEIQGRLWEAEHLKEVNELKSGRINTDINQKNSNRNKKKSKNYAK